MFKLKPEYQEAELDRVITKLLETMYDEDCISEDYTKMVDHVTALYQLKEQKASRRVSPDTLAIVIGNLVGIIFIVGHERAHVLTSKAMNFVLKLR